MHNILFLKCYHLLDLLLKVAYQKFGDTDTEQQHLMFLAMSLDGVHAIIFRPVLQHRLREILYQTARW